MSQTLTFIVRGTPIPKGRGRAHFTGGVGTSKPIGIGTITPQKTKNYAHEVQSAAKAAVVGKKMITGAIAITCEFRLPIPDSWPFGKKAAAAAGLIYHVVKPDIDNLEKAIFDACNNVVWDDDTRIVDSHSTKVYSSEPCAIINVESLEDA